MSSVIIQIKPQAAPQIVVKPQEAPVIQVRPMGERGLKGDKGETGIAGSGVPDGGATGQILMKVSNTNQDTSWSHINGGYF